MLGGLWEGKVYVTHFLTTQSCTESGSERTDKNLQAEGNVLRPARQFCCMAYTRV
jgi:hypothetical protein